MERGSAGHGPHAKQIGQTGQLEAPLPPVPRSQRNDNFIDKSFTVMADLILKVLPTNRATA